MLSYNSTEKRNILWSYILFLIWPVVSFFVALRNFGSPYSNIIIVFFYGLFGYTYIYDESSDSSRHALSFKYIAEEPFNRFLEIIGGLYSGGSGKPDFFMDFIAFVVSRFTEDSKIYFFTLSIILSLVLLKNINYFHSLYKTNKNIISLIFLSFFFVLMPPSRILSFRHYVALLFFVYGVYKYFSTKNKLYILLVISTGFVHFGFLMAVGLFFGYLVARNRNIAYYVLIVLSFIFYSQAASLLRQYGLELDIGLDSTVRGYTHDKYLEEVSQLQSNRNVVINSYNRWTSLFFILFLIYHKVKFKNFDKVSENIYSFLLLFFAFINFTQGIESITNRFSIVFQILACIFFIHLYVKNTFRWSPLFKNVAIIFLILNFLVLFRITIQYANLLLIVPFLPISLFTDSDFTILNFIK